VLPVLARLDAGLEVQVDERRADWAHIVCSNGWAGWVDHRLLIDRPAPAHEPVPGLPPLPSAPGPAAEAVPEPLPTPVPEAAPFAFGTALAEPAVSDAGIPVAEPEAVAEPETVAEPTEAPSGGRGSAAVAAVGTWSALASLAAAVGVAGAFLGWATDNGTSTGLDVPVQFLVDSTKVETGAVQAGYVAIALALAGGIIAWFPRLHLVRRLLGVLLVAVAALFVVQLDSLLSAEANPPSLTSTVDIGIVLVFAAGVLLAVLPRAALAAPVATTLAPAAPGEPAEPGEALPAAEVAPAAVVEAPAPAPEPSYVAPEPSPGPVTAAPEITAEAAERPAAPVGPGPSGAWRPTHVVGGFGAPAWSRPDPALPVIAELAPGVELEVVQRAGGWAFVRAENGWTAWLDEARLIAR
jgi:hypothetical protein